MKDTFVGVIGALVIVGSLASAIAFLEEEDLEDGAPAALDQTRWSGEMCRSLTLLWTVEPDLLGEHVEPWSVREDGTGEAEFRLVAWECEGNTVNNVREGAESGALALVTVEDPEDDRNVTGDEWRASPEVIRAPGEAVGEAFAEHGFPVSSGSITLDIVESLAAVEVQGVIDSGDGELEVSGVFLGMAEGVEQGSATLAPDTDRFSVFVGATSGEQREAFQASVESTGETWVETLGLGDPEAAWFVSGEDWRFSMWDLPFDAERPVSS